MATSRDKITRDDSRHGVLRHDEGRGIQITLWIGRGTYADVQREARKIDISKSEFIRCAIRRALAPTDAEREGMEEAKRALHGLRGTAALCPPKVPPMHCDSPDSWSHGWIAAMALIQDAADRALARLDAATGGRGDG